MKREIGIRTAVFAVAVSLVLVAGASAISDLRITGVIDGPLSGGTPKAIEIYVCSDIADLSIYGLGSANNGGGTDEQEFTFPADSASAGVFLYVATDEIFFSSFLGFEPNYIHGSAPSVNGNDAIELFMNDAVVDVFGEITHDAPDDESGDVGDWDYHDGWAYRVDNTGPDGNAFVLANWTFSGPNALAGETENATASVPFPIGTFEADCGTSVPEGGATLVMLLIAATGLVRVRRREAE